MTRVRLTRAELKFRPTYVISVALLVLSVNTAQAQTPDPMHRMEFAAGGLLTGQTSFGSATATLFRPDGTPFDLFRTDSSLRPGFGIEAHLGVALSRAFAVEGTGSWLRTNFRTEILDDAEDAVTDALTERLSRFTIEASALWSFWRGTKAAWFVRGGAGWMRELAGDSALLEDGLIVNVGVGMKYWWSRRDRGGLKRTGLRVEGRANLHSTGIVLGEEKLRITPVAAAHLIFGF